MEDPAQSPIRIPPPSLEFDSRRSGEVLTVGRVESDATEIKPVDEMPDAVPFLRFDAPFSQLSAEFFHSVGTGGQAEYADLVPGVERREGVGPSLLHCRA